MKQLCCWLLLALFCSSLWAQPAMEPYLVDEIKAFLKTDQANPPKSGQIVLYGSSSLRLWETASNDLSINGLTVINRGFGGSQAYQANYFFEQVVVPHHPKYLILYEGDNDINAGKSIDDVYREMAAMVDKTRRLLPDTRLIVLGVKHSGSRIGQMDTQKTLNKKLRRLCRKTRRVYYVDTATPLLDASGKPDAKYFKEDQLHLNAAGYALWREAVLSQMR